MLDVGCGNGYSTNVFAKEIRHSTFTGVDYSAPMIAQAQDRLRNKPLRNLSFEVANVLDLYALKRKYDIVISERCLINLKDWDDQRKALVQIKGILNPGGKLILVENTQEGLDNLNKLRLSVGLHKIETRWHNSYLPQREFMSYARKNFTIQHVENIGNLYYIISRVVYAKIAQMEGREPVYGHPINEIAAKLPSLPTYNYSPNYMFILRNQ